MWKSLGWSSIIYIASISGIDQELYEAATVDGANRFGCIWHITIPSLIPTYFVLLILSIANFINTGMEQYYLFQNAMNKSTIEVLDLYVYNRMMDQNYSFGIAVGFKVAGQYHNAVCRKPAVQIYTGRIGVLTYL